jgi:hypothetical protein
MKKLFPLILMFFAASAYGQTPNFATGTRATNGKLVSIANILPLSDCQIRNVSGKVRKINVDGNLVHFQLWDKEHKITPEERAKIEESFPDVDNSADKKDKKKKHKKKKKMRPKKKIELNLSRLSTADRAAIFNDMIRKSFRLRVAGYDCSTNDVISAFSIDLIY